jgi:hypothetical protein
MEFRITRQYEYGRWYLRFIDHLIRETGAGAIRVERDGPYMNVTAGSMAMHRCEARTNAQEGR